MAKKRKSDLDNLRAEVARERAKATAKISRVRKSIGAELTGTEYDVRRASGAHRNYNARQLENYLSELREFTHRGTKFEALENGAPVAKPLASEHRRTLERHQRMALRHEEKFGSLPSPTAEGMTLKEEREENHQKNPYRVDLNVTPFGQYAETEKVRSSSALRESIASMNRMMNRAKSEERLRAFQGNIVKMFNQTGDETMANMVANMNTEQLLYLQYNNKFIAVKDYYQNKKSAGINGNGEYSESLHEIDEALASEAFPDAFKVVSAASTFSFNN